MIARASPDKHPKEAQLTAISTTRQVGLIIAIFTALTSSKTNTILE
jgi:hypothetical protein